MADGAMLLLWALYEETDSFWLGPQPLFTKKIKKMRPKMDFGMILGLI
jgi:hypothetical protein